MGAEKMAQQFEYILVLLRTVVQLPVPMSGSSQQPIIAIPVKYITLFQMITVPICAQTSPPLFP